MATIGKRRWLPNQLCQKCGGDAAISWNSYTGILPADTLWATCGRCGYKWRVTPLDGGGDYIEA